MSGHSHAKTIKHQKNLTDQKRGSMFSKIARLISVAVKAGGPNPDTNYKLKMAFEQAKTVNMPKENVERAIRKATGEEESERLEEVIFEAFGPKGLALIIEGITDNKNRTITEIKQILNQHNGKLAGEGAVKWLFDRKGGISINLDEQTEELKNKENLELIAIEAGADNLIWRDNYLDIHTKQEDLEKVKRALEEKGIKIESASLDWMPKEKLTLAEGEKASVEKLLDAFDENEDVQDVYSNLQE